MLHDQPNFQKKILTGVPPKEIQDFFKQEIKKEASFKIKIELIMQVFHY